MSYLTRLAQRAAGPAAGGALGPRRPSAFPSAANPAGVGLGEVETITQSRPADTPSRVLPPDQNPAANRPTESAVRNEPASTRPLQPPPVAQPPTVDPTMPPTGPVLDDERSKRTERSDPTKIATEEPLVARAPTAPRIPPMPQEPSESAQPDSAKMPEGPRAAALTEAGQASPSVLEPATPPVQHGLSVPTMPGQQEPLAPSTTEVVDQTPALLRPADTSYHGAALLTTGEGTSSASALASPPAGSPTSPAPIDVHIGTIEIASEPAPAPAYQSRLKGFGDYADIRRYDWGR